jgi:chromosome segregation ATPase
MNGDLMNTQPTIDTILQSIQSQGQDIRQVLATLEGLGNQQVNLGAQVQRLQDQQQKFHDQQQKFDGQLHKFDGQLQKLHEETHQTRLEQKELNEEILVRLRRLESRLEGLGDAWLDRVGDTRDLRRRVEKLESQPVS